MKIVRDIIESFPPIGETLKDRKLVLYGTGDGAEKIALLLKSMGLFPCGVFASDGFVRNRSFMGMPVLSFEDARERFGDFTALLCFGTDRKDVLSNIRRIAEIRPLLAPDVPVAGGPVFDRDYALLHEAELEEVRALLSDDQSRLVFDCVLKYRLSWNPSYLYECETDEDELWRLFGASVSDCFADAGAYTGDTAEAFIKAAGGFPSAIYAFEPDPRNYRKLCENPALSGCNIKAYNIALCDEKTTLYFAKNSGRGSAALAKKTFAVSADRLGSVLFGQTVSALKFDVEGLENAAIDGAAEIISAQRPRIMCAAYHRSEDIFSIPLKLLSLRGPSSLYLRHSPCLPAWELNYIVSD